MYRLVVPNAIGVGNGRFRSDANGQSGGGDNYLDRLIKYIPAESIAVYVLVDRLVGSYYGLTGFTPPPTIGTAFYAWSIFIFALGLIGTPVYLRRQRAPGQPWVLHAVLSTIAFACWAYTIGGTIFVLSRVYSMLAAGVVAPVFTYVAGFFEPK